MFDARIVGLSVPERASVAGSVRGCGLGLSPWQAAQPPSHTRCSIEAACPPSGYSVTLLVATGCVAHSALCTSAGGGTHGAPLTLRPPGLRASPSCARAGSSPVPPMPAPEPDPASHLEREHEASTPSPAEPPRWQSQLVPPHPRFTHWCITHSPPSYHPPHCAAVSTTANGRSAPSCRRRYVGARAPSQCATPSAAAVAKASTPALIKAFQRATSCGARMCAPSGTCGATWRGPRGRARGHQSLPAHEQLWGEAVGAIGTRDGASVPRDTGHGRA